MNLALKPLISQTVRSFKAPLALTIGIELISHLQIIHIILKVIEESNGEKSFILIHFLNYVLSYVGEFTPVGLHKQNDDILEFAWIIFAIYLIMHMLIFLSVNIFSKTIVNDKRSRVSSLVSLLYLLHSRVIFFLAHFFFIGLIKFNIDCDLAEHASKFCEGGWLVGNIVLCIVNLGLAFLKETFLYQITPSKDTYAIKNNLYHQNALLHKTLLILLYFFVQGSDGKEQATTIVNLIFLIFSMAILYFKLPFYNITVLKMSIVFTGTTFSFSLLSVLLIAGVDKQILEIICSALIPLVIKTLLSCYDLLSDKIMSGNFKSPERALHYVLQLKNGHFGCISSSIYNQDYSYGAITSNGIFVHQKLNVEKLFKIGNKKEFEDQIYSHIIEKLNNVLEKHPNSKILLFFMAEICLKKLENIPRTIILIKKLESLSLSIPAQNSLDEFNLKLKDLHKSGYLDASTTNQDMFSYFKYKGLAISLRDNIGQEVQLHQELWDELKKENVNVKKTLDITYKIDIFSALVQRKYEAEFKNFTQHFINPLILYGAYLELIKEYADDAKKLIKQFWNLSRSQARGHGLDVYCEEIGVVIISIEKANLGAIVDASGSMQSIFQIDKKQLIGQQLTCLLPSVIANALIRIIKSYAKEPSRKLDKNFVTYGKTPEGNFFEIEVQLKLYPKVDREVKLMCVFRKVAAPKPIIMVNTEGLILECSENLKMSLNIKGIDQGTTKFYEIAPEYEKINLAFNQVYNNNSGIEVFSSFRSKIRSSGSKIHNKLLTKEMTKSVDSTNFGKENTKNKIKRLETGLNSSLGGFSIERYKDLCNEFTEGSKMRLLIPDGTGLGMKTEVIYDVQILPYQLNGEVYKIIVLSTSDEAKSPSLLLGPKETFVAKIEESVKSDFADLFEEVDERIPQGKLLNAKDTLQIKGVISEIVSKKPSYVSEETLSSARSKSKNGLKIPDSDNFIQQGKSPIKAFKKGKSHAAENEGSVSSTSSRTLASVKALKNFFGKDQTFVLSKRASIILFAIVALMIGLGIYNYFISKDAIDQVVTGVSIVNLASLRLSQAMRGWQFATRFWLRFIDLRSGQIGPLQASALLAGQTMIQRNKELTHQLASIKERGLFSEIIEPNIYLWELDEDTTTTGGPVDSTSATNVLGNKFITLGSVPDVNNDATMQLVKYLSNNTCNDYYISSEKLIDATHRMLQITLSNNISNLQLVLGLEIAALVGLCLSLLIMARLVVQLHRRLFRALVKIDEYNLTHRVYQVQRMKAFLSEDIELRGFGLNSLDEARKANPIYHQKEKTKGKMNPFNRKGGFQKRSERLIFKGLILDLVKYVLTPLIVIQVVTALFVVSLTESLNSFRSSQDVTQKLSVTTKAAYRSSVIVSTVYMDMDFRNDTKMKVRNEAPVDQIHSVIKSFSNVNNELIAVFSEDGKGITDPLIQEIFQDTICKYLPDSLQDYCETATDGGQLGLLAVNSQIISTEEFYVTKYLSNPTYDNAKSMIDPYISLMRPAAEVLEGSYEFINARIVSNFNEDMDTFLSKITILHIGIFISILLSAVVVQMVAINRFKFLDMCRGNVLKTLSYKILLEDKAIGFYLNRHFVNTNNALSKIL